MDARLRTIRFGVNYTPSHEWYYGWNSWNPDHVAKDLDAIAGLGADHIRVMLIWPYFQPNPSWVSETHLARLGSLMDLAEERALDVCLVLLNGWLSGYHFGPPSVSRDAFYSDEQTQTVIKHYVDAVVQAVRGRRNLLGFDLGNEINCAWLTDDLQAGDRWMRHWLDYLVEHVPEGIHVNGVDHQPWFHPATFSPAALAAAQPIISLHSWIKFTRALERGGPMDACCRSLAAGMAALARSYAGDPAKPVWIQEFGASERWMPTEAIPAFLEAATLDGLAAGVSWFTWWASHDLRPEMRFDDLEYSLGLLTVDNQPKPQAHVFKELAAAHRGKPVTISTTQPAPPSHDMESTWRWIEDWLASSSFGSAR